MTVRLTLMTVRLKFMTVRLTFMTVRLTFTTVRLTSCLVLLILCAKRCCFFVLFTSVLVALTSLEPAMLVSRLYTFALLTLILRVSTMHTPRA